MTPGTSKPGTTAPGKQSQGSRRFGTFSVRAALKKVPGKKGSKAKLTVSFLDAGLATVGKATAKVKAGRKARLKLSGTAEAGSYRYVVRAGRTTLKRGGFTVKPKAGKTLPAGTVIRARAR